MKNLNLNLNLNLEQALISDLVGCVECIAVAALS